MDDRLDKIKSGAYWRVNIRPTTFKKDRISSLSEVRRMVEECSVKLRGWDYPHIEPEETQNGDDWVQSGCDWEGFIEYWRFYQSAQFIHYFSVYEDYEPRVKELVKATVFIKPSEEPSGYLSIFSTLYRITEIYEFAMRLVQKGVIEPNVHISIKLCGIKNHQLFYWDRGAWLRKAFVSITNDITMESTMGVEELLAKGYEEAIKQTIYLFERFNWVNPSREIMTEKQKKLLERRL